MGYQINQWVVVKNWKQAREGNGITTENYIAQLASKEYDGHNGTSYTGMDYDTSAFAVVAEDRKNEFYRIKKDHIIRYATPEEILEEAVRRYPPGTKYDCIRGYHVEDIITTKDELRIYGKNKIDIYGKGFIYYEGTWSKILEHPGIQENYLIY